MGAIKKWIPNILTLGNFTCGMLACFLAASYDIDQINHLEPEREYSFFYSARYILPSLFVFGAAIFDFLDGFVARLLNIHSELGKQLDSLADVVSFGVAPSFIIARYELTGNDFYSSLGFLIGIFACIRLAKFNIDTRQSESFLGLPVPSVGIIIASLPFIDKNGPLAFLVNPWVVASLVVLLCALMVSELPLLALKFKNYTLKDNLYRYLVLLVGLVSLILFQFQGLPLIILGYVLISFIAVNKRNI